MNSAHSRQLFIFLNPIAIEHPGIRSSVVPLTSFGTLRQFNIRNIFNSLLPFVHQLSKVLNSLLLSAISVQFTACSSHVTLLQDIRKTLPLNYERLTCPCNPSFSLPFCHPVSAIHSLFPSPLELETPPARPRMSSVRALFPSAA